MIIFYLGVKIIELFYWLLIIVGVLVALEFILSLIITALDRRE